jgi:hypothetical protein
VIKVDKRIGRPERIPQFLSRDRVPRLFQQQAQKPKGLFL